MTILALRSALGMDGSSGAATYTVAWRGDTAAATLPSGDSSLTAGNVTAGAGATLEIPYTGIAYDPNKVWQIVQVGSTARTTLALAITNNVYVEVTVNRTGDWNPQAIRLKAARGGASGVRGFAVRSSHDNYATDLLTDLDVDTTRPTLTQYGPADLSSWGTKSGPVTFRLYHFATATGSSLEFDDLEIDYQAAGGGAVTPTLVHRVLGIPSGTEIPMATRTTSATSVRGQCSTSATFASGIISGSAATPNAQGDSQLTVTGLSPNSSYYQRIGMTDSGGTETFSAISSVPFRTDNPGVAGDFTFSFSSCDDAVDSTVFTTLAARNDDFFLHLGDWPHDTGASSYADGTGTTVTNFRNQFTKKLQAANHQALYDKTPMDYGPSDHDGMTNGSNAGSDATAWTNWNSTVRELLPLGPYPGATGVYKTWTRNRVRFIKLDRRSFATAPSATDNSSKTCLGATQKQWLKDTITASTEAAILIPQESPWIGSAVAGDDGWAGYTTERAELASFFAASGKKIIMLAGDMHALAADDGTNAPGGITVWHAAPLENSTSIKGGPYSTGTYPTSGTAVVSQYGRCVVTDNGTNVTLAFTGYSADNTQRITLTTVTTGPVANSRTDTYAVRTAVAQTVADTYAVRTPVAQTVADTYAVRTPVASARTDTYGVLAAAASTRSETYGVRAAVTATVSDTYAVIVAPATILNIGPGAGQNHFSLQYARTGDASPSAATQADLAAGFQESPYFTSVGNRVQFQARADAPIIPGSGGARSELREVNADGSTAGWDPNIGVHEFHGRSAITHLPPLDPEVVIAQLHDGNSDGLSIRTQLVSGTIRLRARVYGTSITSPQFASPYVEGTEFEWKIRLDNGAVSFFYNDMVTPFITRPAGTLIPTAGVTTWYWKTGSYNQFDAASAGATEYASVELRDLSTTHPAVTTTSVENSVTDTYAVRTPVASSVSDTQAIRAVVTQSVADTYAVRTAVAAASRADTFSVGAVVAQSVADSWAVRTPVAGTRTDTYAVRAVATATRTETYAVAAGLVATRSDTYAVRTPISQSAGDTWAVRSSVTGAISDTFAARAVVTSSVTEAFNVLVVGITTVTGTRTDTYAVRAAVAGTSTETYAVRAALSANRSDAWAVRTTVQQAAGDTYSVRGALTSFRTDTFAVQGSVVSSRAESWAVRALVSAAATEAWSVLTTVAPAVRTDTWAVRGGVVKPAGDTWAIRALATGSRTDTYAVRVAVLGSAADTWAALRSAVRSVADTYAVRAIVVWSVTEQWNTAQATPPLVPIVGAPSETLVVTPESRTVLVEPESRTLVVPAAARAFVITRS